MPLCWMPDELEPVEVGLVDAVVDELGYCALDECVDEGIIDFSWERVTDEDASTGSLPC